MPYGRSRDVRNAFGSFSLLPYLFTSLLLLTLCLSSQLCELNGYTDSGIGCYCVALDTDYLSSLYAGKLSFLFGKVHCPREIYLNDVSRPYWCRHRHRQEHSAFCHVDGFAVKESVCFRQPDAHRPGKHCSHCPAVFYCGFYGLFHYLCHNSYSINKELSSLYMKFYRQC